MRGLKEGLQEGQETNYSTLHLSCEQAGHDEQNGRRGTNA